MKKYLPLLFVLLFLISISGCVEEQSSLTELPYASFEDLPEDYTPEQALEDGYLVITQVKGEDDRAVAELYGGAEIWDAFLEASEAGRDARMGVISFWSDGNISCEILVYKDGRYIYSESASDMAKETSSFQDLRKLTGTLPNAEREDSVYVLTDSQTLTYQDVLWKYLSSSTETVTDIPFVWLFFPDYCENN